jgi:hypothetical protein
MYCCCRNLLFILRSVRELKSGCDACLVTGRACIVLSHLSARLQVRPPTVPTKFSSNVSEAGAFIECCIYLSCLYSLLYSRPLFALSVLCLSCMSWTICFAARLPCPRWWYS